MTDALVSVLGRASYVPIRTLILIMYVSIGILGSGAMLLVVEWHRRRTRIRRLALELARVGFVRLRGWSAQTKKLAWDSYLPKLVAHWESVLPSFDLAQPRTWPVIENGRAYAYTYRRCGEYPIRLWQHRKARAVASQFSSHRNFEGEDNGWGIVNFPHPTFRGPTPWHAHLDDGKNSSFRTTFPVDGFDLLERQTAIALHCCTPGDLEPETGATVLYPGSHLLVLGLLARRPVRWDALRSALAEGVLKKLAVQTTIGQDEMLVMCGALVHGTSYCERPMPGDLPRVIMNPKLWARSKLPRRNSILAACVREPRRFWPQDDLATFDTLLDALDSATARHCST